MLYSGFNQFFKTKGTPFTIVADQDVAVKETINSIPKDERKPYIDRYDIKTDRESREEILNHLDNKGIKTYFIIS